MRTLSLVLPLILLAVPVSAQTPLLREDDPAPGLPGRFIVGLSSTAANNSDGFAAVITASDFTSGQTQIWGNLTGGQGALIREEATFGAFTQNSIDSAFAISASSAVYTTLTTEAGGANNVDGIWQDDTLIALDGSAIPGTSETFTFLSGPNVTESGTPYFIGRRSGGGRALFSGTTPTSVIGTGDMLPGLPAPLGNVAVDNDYRLSALGNRYIAPVSMDTGSNTNDAAIVIDGAGVIAGGVLIQELTVVPTSVGGVGGEAWDNFDFCGITESGNYAFTGDTNGPLSMDEIIVRNGTIWARESDTLAGEVLAGPIRGAALNESNQLAFAWGVEDGSGGILHAVFIEDELIIKAGDEVDWDGNGVPDPGVTFDSVTGTNALSLSNDGRVYFTADVLFPSGARLEGYFGLSGTPVGTNYCGSVVNSTGMAATIVSEGSASLQANDLVISSINMPVFQFGFFITSQTQNFVTNPGGSTGNLCLGGSIGREVGGGAANTGAAGVLTANVDFTSLPQPNGTVSAVVGETWNFQAWARDSVMGVGTSNFSDGYAVTIR